MEFKKYNTKKLNKKTINLNQSYKKEQKSSKREREYLQFFVWKKIWRRRVKIQERGNEEESLTVK